MKTYNFILKAILFFITAVIILTSCNRSNDPLEDKSPGTVTFKISEVVFESEDQLGARSATPHHAGDVSYASVQRNAVEFGDDLLMVAELSADDSPNLSPATKASLKDASRTALDTSNLGVGIRYRVVVYNTTTQLYVTERDYTRGSEPAIGDLQLDGGTRYTFVVYSVNSTSTTLPAISPAIGRTLTNSTIVVNGNQDYMYFQQELTVNGNATNNLNIVLKHRFSQITTVINSIATGYNITSVTSNFKPHAATTIATLSTGNFTGTVSAAGSPVTFTTPNA
ncbi:hypothetical protein [Sphingobacterium chungjuense]|uniref:hypothetical protein n=1 Tax=Sphingobacterium chungjuense TaxID=2675553 RepID=UPI00140AAD61|nr:hypothetical protein [Sphingobacterium chungjuense]